jgi:CRISPR type III-B/RAMP module-associated protein Cmr5
MSVRISNDQVRAKKAWDFSQADGAKANKEYRSYVREFPMLVHNSGLVNAVAFAYEKGKVANNGTNAWAILYKQLSEWLSKECGHPIPLKNNSLLETLLNLSNQDSPTFRRLTHETIILFTWLKRFVSEK